MTQPNERSDPVQGHTEVTTEQLDALHANCDMWCCHGKSKQRERERLARVQRSMADMTQGMARINGALREVGESIYEATRWTQAQQEQALQANYYRDNLRAALESQRIGFAQGF